MPWMLPMLAPRGEAHAGAGAGRGAIARYIVEPVHLQVFDRTGDRHPVQDFRTAAHQLVARQPLQELGVLAGERLEYAAVELLVDHKVAEPTGRDDADARGAGKALDREPHQST